MADMINYTVNDYYDTQWGHVLQSKQLRQSESLSVSCLCHGQYIALVVVTHTIAVTAATGTKTS